MPRTKKPNTKDKAQHTVPPEEQLTAVTGNTDATIAAPEQEAPAVTAKADAADAAPAAVAEKEETAEAAVNAAAEAAAENIIPFAPIIRSSDVFNAPYTKEQWLAAGLPERKFEQFHELQTKASTTMPAAFTLFKLVRLRLGSAGQEIRCRAGPRCSAETALLR